MISEIENIQDALGRELSQEEQRKIQRMDERFKAILERHLNRVLEETEITEIHWLDGYSNSLRLHRGPVNRVLQVVYIPMGGVPNVFTSYRQVGDTIDFMGGDFMGEAKFEITYYAGDQPTDPAVQEVVEQAIVRRFLTPASVTAGVSSSYSVEGTSISYNGPGSGKGGVGPFLEDEISSLARLNRLVFG